jgi:ATP-binding cassette subfamily C protein CydC
VWQRLAGALRRPVETRRRYDWIATPGAVEVQDLSIDRGRGLIVVGLTFDAQPGQTVVLTGRSGAGKTSVLAALSGQLRTEPGQIRATGLIVRLPQRPHVFRGSVADNLRLGDPEATDELLLDILSLTGLASALGDDPLAEQIGTGARPLSGGQARRLALAQALLSRPDVLLADEPTEGLDPRAARDIWRALRQSRPSMTLILALHDQQLAQLTWTPDTVVRLHTDRTEPDVAHPARTHR